MPATSPSATGARAVGSITSIGVTDSARLTWTSCNARASARAVGKRPVGSFAIPVASARSRESGTSSRPIGGTGAAAIRALSAIAEWDAPGTSKGGRPASSVYSVAVREYTSDCGVPRLSSVRTSGGDHGREMPDTSSSSSTPTIAEMPKSVSAGRPYSVRRTLAGLMSRWTMPARCAVSTAPATWMPMRRTSATGNRSRRYLWARLPPGQYSMTRNGRPSAATSARWMVAIAGCVDSPAMRFASTSNRRRAPSSSTSWARTLTATRRRGMCCS